MDFRTYDLRNLFYLREVAMAWCEIEVVTPANKRCHASMICALLEAVASGELEVSDSILALADSAPLPPYHMVFARDELKRWAIFKGQQPKFLFPEMRAEAPQGAMKKEAAPRKSQIMKQRCLAVAAVLWEMNPDYMIKDVAAHPYMKEHGYCRGSYELRTIQEWVKEADPRPHEAKKTPFGKAPEKSQLSLQSTHRL